MAARRVSRNVEALSTIDEKLSASTIAQKTKNENRGAPIAGGIRTGCNDGRL
jgi:hypothetical protein